LQNLKIARKIYNDEKDEVGGIKNGYYVPICYRLKNISSI
jgi:hypothetical protein